jgi:CBS domain containing-hemolysin-like protein
MALASAAEASLAGISRAGVQQMLDEGASRTRAVLSLLQNPPRFVITLMVLKGAAFVAAAGAVTWLAAQADLNWQLGVPLALLAVWLLLLCVQVVSRALTLRSGHMEGLRLGRPLRGVAILLSPLTGALRALGNLVLGRSAQVSADNLFLSEDGLRFLIDMSDEQGLIEEDEKEMIASIFELSETVAREVMVPRIDVISVEERTSLRDSLDVIIAAGHSRIPVYRESIDHVQGVLYAKDMLPPFRDGQHDLAITELMRPAYFVPESKKVDDLLSELQQRKVHMAIVVDEYGGTAGVVTIEDLLEEIVGEIQDEYDTELPRAEMVGENEFLFDARISLDDACKMIGIEPLDADSDTLGGFMFSRLGRMPVSGSRVEYKDLVFQVESISGRRIELVQVIRSPGPRADTQPAEPDAKRSLSTLSSLF